MKTLGRGLSATMLAAVILAGTPTASVAYTPCYEAQRELWFCGDGRVTGFCVSARFRAWLFC